MTRSKWDIRMYDVLQFIPTDAYQAVYADWNEDGTWSFSVHDIEGIAVARVTTVEMSSDGADEHGCSINPREDGRLFHNAIVGVDLSEMGFDVCDEACNFAGLLKRGQKIDIENGVGTYHVRDPHFHSRFTPDKYRPANKRPHKSTKAGGSR